MERSFFSQYSSIDDLRKKARKKIPEFAFEYWRGGGNEATNLSKNTEKIRELELEPFYFKKINPPSIKTDLLGETYDALIRIVPIEKHLRNDLLKRVGSAGYKVLDVIAEVLVFAFRSREIRQGISLPPSIMEQLCCARTEDFWLRYRNRLK